MTTSTLVAATLRPVAFAEHLAPAGTAVYATPRGDGSFEVRIPGTSRVTTVFARTLISAVERDAA